MKAETQGLSVAYKFFNAAAKQVDDLGANIESLPF